MGIITYIIDNVVLTCRVIRAAQFTTYHMLYNAMVHKSTVKPHFISYKNT